MDTKVLTFTKVPSYHCLKILLSEQVANLNNKQLLNRYGKLLLAMALFARGKLDYAARDNYLYTNMCYMESVYKQELENRRLFKQYSFFIE